MSSRSLMSLKIILGPLALFMALLSSCGSSGGNGNDEQEDQPVVYNGDDASGEAKAVPSLTSCYKGDVWTCEVEAAIVRETNLLRSKALIQSFEDSFVAREWSGAQATAGKISHDGFPVQRKTSLQTHFNAKWGVFAENVAMAQTDDSDPARVGKIFVQMWNGSAGHRTNMLGNYRYLGAGVVRSGNAVYATQIFH